MASTKKPPPKMVHDVKKLTAAIQKILLPFINDVTTLQNGKVKKEKGKSVSADVLVLAVEKTIDCFVSKSLEIANNRPDIANLLHDAMKEVQSSGRDMFETSRQFAKTPCVSKAREQMVLAARQLLASVTEVLIIADTLDVNSLMNSLTIVRSDLEKFKTVKNQDDLLKTFQTYDKNAALFFNQIVQRQPLLNRNQVDSLAAARAALERNRPLLQIASQTYLSHPNVKGAKENRDIVLKQMCEALDTIKGIALDGDQREVKQRAQVGLLSELDEFDNDFKRIVNGEQVSQKKLEDTLDSLMNDLYKVSDSDCISSDRKNRMIEACKNLKTSLQDVLFQFEDNLTNPEVLKAIKRKIVIMRCQLGKAVDQDSLLQTGDHLENLIQVARTGNSNDVEEYGAIFAQHNEKLIEVAKLLSSMTNNSDGATMAILAANHIEGLFPQVINAARILVVQPKSEIAESNMQHFKAFYAQQLDTLLAAIDAVTTISDFLSVCDSQLLDDMQKCIVAIESGDYKTFNALIDNVRKRIARITKLVTDEMSDYEPCFYTKQVLEAIRVLNEELLPNFDKRIEEVKSSLKTDPDNVDDKDFMEAFNLTYTGIRDIRAAVLMTTPDDELDPEDTEVEPVLPVELLMEEDTIDNNQVEVDEFPEISGIKTARDAMAQLPEAERLAIQEQVKTFESERKRLDEEVLKWKDESNNLVLVAKYMSKILTHMTEFTSGEGPLKTTFDVITAAQHISQAGTKFNTLTEEFVRQCADTTFSKELIQYSQQIPLYCNQLKITSSVKADVEVTAGELKISGLDSATSLLQTSKNLMVTVIKIVQFAFLASLKSKNKMVTWRMKVPAKKPLVMKDKQVDIVRKVSVRRPSPAHVLSEYEEIQI